MLTYDSFTKVITQEKKGKTTPERAYWIYSWQDLRIIIRPVGVGLRVQLVNQFEQIMIDRRSNPMDENTDFTMYDLHKTQEIWQSAIEIANRFYEEKNWW